MATPAEKLAESLQQLKAIQDKGSVAIRSRSLSRTHRERLLRNGFITEVIKGWYIPSRPDKQPGESTSWYASFWKFCGDYLSERFGKDWCLSPEQSLRLHCGNWQVPKQLLVRSPKGNNKPVNLPHDTSLFDLRLTLPDARDIQVIDGMRIFSLPAALIACSPGTFAADPIVSRTALSMIQDSSQVLHQLLDGGHSQIAGRLAGAFRNIGHSAIADAILEAMRSAGYTVNENDPFEDKPRIDFGARQISPYVTRLHLGWAAMRDVLIENFPLPSGVPTDMALYLKAMDDLYTQDAYHSLSIEGYQVNEALIDAVRAGSWNPDAHKEHQQQKDALAARGYWQSFQAVKQSVQNILSGQSAGEVAQQDHDRWYRELFAPSVEAGILKSSDLAGYRNHPVYIRRSMHVPPSREAVYDLMPAFFDLLSAESSPAVRAVLGHFMFVYIHPYMDGNGRVGRFLMNAMLASGGYPWTIVPLDARDRYMSALEEASVNQNILPFTKLIADLVGRQIT